MFFCCHIWLVYKICRADMEKVEVPGTYIDIWGGGPNWIIKQSESNRPPLTHKSLVKLWSNQYLLRYSNIEIYATKLQRLYWMLQRLYWMLQRLYWMLQRLYWMLQRLYWMLQRLYWFLLIIIPLRGPSCKQRLERFSAKLKFQDGPSVAIIKLSHVFLLSHMTCLQNL